MEQAQKFPLEQSSNANSPPALIKFQQELRHGGRFFASRQRQTTTLSLCTNVAVRCQHNLEAIIYSLAEELSSKLP
jgi:hypothetical protein